MVVYSTGHLDQNGVAARVVHHGIGVVGETTADTAEVIEGRLDTVLGDRQLRDRIETLQATANDPAQIDQAARLLEAIASGSRP